MRKNKILLSLAAVAAIALPSCHSSKKAATTDGNPVASRSVISRNSESDAITQSLVQGRQSWTDVQLPLNVKLSNPLSVTLNATAYMRRGEYIKMSVRILGMEIANAWIDTDSIHVVDKMGKRYVSESISSVTTELGLDVADLQDLLMGRLFKINGDEVEMTDFSTEPTEYDNMILLRPKTDEAIDYGFMARMGETPVISYFLVDAGRFSAVAQYVDYESTQAGLLAKKVALQSSEPKKVSAELTWNYGSAKWNKDNRQKWQAPGKGYSKISLASLLSILNKL